MEIRNSKLTVVSVWLHDRDSCDSVRLRWHGPRRETHLTAPGLFCAIHCAICAPHERLRRISVPGRESDSNTGADVNAVTPNVDGPLDLGDDGSGDLLGLGRIADPNQNDDELITARAGDQISPPRVALQYSGHVTQHPVTAFVSVAVVHLLEIVQIDLQEGQLGGSA